MYEVNCREKTRAIRYCDSGGLTEFLMSVFVL